MRRPVEVYANRPDQGRWTSGSGYLLAPRLVLTAAHVVCPAGRVLSTVRVRAASGGLVTAEVAWHRYADGVDIALLVITDRGWVEPAWRHPVRWGRLVTTRAGQDCEAIGFPAVVAEPEQRDSHHAVGVLHPGALVKARLYAVEVTNPPAARPGGSGWAGMSGAGLLCQDLLVGVVTVDPKGFDSRRLITVPVAAVAADAGFAGLVAEHTGSAPIVEPVELAGLAESVAAPDSPAGLLRADAAVVPFRDRPELADLQDWCHGPGWSGVRLVVGAGGQGKTRLGRELATQLAGEGWAAVLVGEHARPADLAVLGEVSEPTLVVVDYAEGRTSQLDALIAAMGRAEAKVRLLLLARTAGAWRTDRVDPAPHLAVLGADDIVVDLRPVEPTPDGRTQAWQDAVTALAPALATLDGYKHVAWTAVAAQLRPPRLDGAGFRTILAVQMHALAALLQAGAPAPVSGSQDPRQVLLEHESRYWTRVADRFTITLTPATADAWSPPPPCGAPPPSTRRARYSPAHCPVRTRTPR